MKKNKMKKNSYKAMAFAMGLSVAPLCGGVINNVVGDNVIQISSVAEAAAVAKVSGLKKTATTNTREVGNEEKRIYSLCMEDVY